MLNNQIFLSIISQQSIYLRHSADATQRGSSLLSLKNPSLQTQPPRQGKTLLHEVSERLSFAGQKSVEQLVLQNSYNSFAGHLGTPSRHNKNTNY